MNRYRSLAGILMLALTLGFITLGNQNANASGYHAVVPQYAVGNARISGLVQDGSGHRLDDVLVEATGDGEATQLTYADDDGNGHGYFNLSVGRGTYSVKLSKEGYTSVTVDDVEISSRRARVDLGTIKLVKKLVKTTTSAKFADDVITTREKGKVQVTVTPGKDKPAGEIVVKEGRDTVGEADLTGSDRGFVVVTLERLSRGQHELKVVYKGNKNFDGSSSKLITLTVKRR